VSNAISLSLEMLRVVPLIIAFIRSFLSPNLTEDERNTPVFGLSPLYCPPDFGSASNLSGVVSVLDFDKSHAIDRFNLTRSLLGVDLHGYVCLWCDRSVEYIYSGILFCICKYYFTVPFAILCNAIFSLTFSIYIERCIYVTSISFCTFTRIVQTVEERFGQISFE
jgi:hypothetical protein